MADEITMEGQEVTQEAAPEKKPRKPRRKMTEEEKAEAKRKRDERKAQADSMKPEVYVQYEGAEAVINDLVDAAIANFRREKKRAKIIECKLYVKPEERAAYYVINGVHDGKIEY